MIILVAVFVIVPKSPERDRLTCKNDYPAALAGNIEIKRHDRYDCLKIIKHSCNMPCTLGIKMMCELFYKVALSGISSLK